MMVKQLFLKSAWIIFCINSFFLCAKASENDSVVATINGESITQRELEAQMQLNRALVYNKFLKEYSIPQDSFSWDGNYSGKIPFQVLKNKSLEDMYQIKIQLLMMKEKGVLMDIRYQTFLNELEKVNQSRKEAVEKGMVVYGPVTYTERNYFDHTFNNNTQKLKTILSAKEIMVNEVILKSRYDSLKYKQFKKGNLLIAERYYISITSDSEAGTLKSKFYDLVAEKINSKIFGEDLINEINGSKNVSFKVSMEIKKFDLSDRNVMESYPAMASEIRNMNYENISKVIEEEESLNILRVLKVEERGFWAFDDVQGFLKLKYIDEKYEALIHEKRLAAKIVVNESALKKILIK